MLQFAPTVPWVKWGNNYASPFLETFPPAVFDETPAGNNVVSLSQGAGKFTVFLSSDGTMTSSGDNDVGQLGTGSMSDHIEKPAGVFNAGVLFGKKVISVSSGYSHSVAVCSDGTVATWGSNQFGELGNNSTDTSRVPIAINMDGLVGRKALFSAGAYHSLLVVAEPETENFGTIAALSSLSEVAGSSDPDGDGITNLMEYVLHGDPNSPSTTILPRMMIEGDNFVFRFDRLTASGNDTNQVFQYSADMIHWSEVGISSGSGVLLGATDANGCQPVAITVPKSGNCNLFGRLKVSRP